MSHDGDAGGDETERWLAGVWAEALEVEHVSLDDDFFALGGDSLAGARILARLEVETGRSLALGALIRAPSVRQLAQVVAEGHSNGASTLTVLRTGGDLPPLVLLHGNTGNAVHYAQLIREPVGGRPLWGLEYLRPGADLRVDAIVSAHRDSLRDSEASTPFLLAGFCYGAAIAHELAARLAADGDEAHVALLGITPNEFPVIASSAALARWGSAGQRSVLTRVRAHGAAARRLPVRRAVPYVAHRASSAARLSWRHLRRRPDTGSSPAQSALAAHRPSVFPGRPLVVLHEDDAARYTSDPEADWAALGTEGVDVVVLPGSDHAMLEADGVAGLGVVLATWAASR